MRVCSGTMCSNRHSAKGFCSKHYYQIKKHGHILAHTRRDYRPAIIESNTALIPLGVNAMQGYAIVDVADAWVDKYHWHKKRDGYVAAWIDGKVRTLHKTIFKSETEIDHRDGDKLNNRRLNLRPATRTQNNRNSPKSIGRSGYRGVSYHKRMKKYVSQISVEAYSELAS